MASPSYRRASRAAAGRFSLAWNYPKLIDEGMELLEGQRKENAETFAAQRALDARRRKASDSLREAGTRLQPDVIALNLRVIFCGINPGLYTAAVGHHFARPGNRFWPALHAGTFELGDVEAIRRASSRQQLLRP